MRTITLAMLLALLIAPATAMFAQTPDNPLQPKPSPVEETSLAPGAEQVDMADDQMADETTQQNMATDTTAADTEAMNDTDSTMEVDSTMEDDSELPRTASPLALLALLGVAGAGSALSLRTARRRS